MFSGPTSRPSCAKTTLTESQVASCQRHHAAARLGVVDRPGRAARGLQRLRRAAVVVGRVGIDALLDRRRQVVDLERGPGLALGVGGEVELAGQRVALGRGQRDDLTVRRVDRGQRRRRSAARVADRAGVDGALRGRLEPRLDRRIDLEAAVLDGVQPVAVLELLLDEVEDVGLADPAVLVPRVEVQTLVGCVLVLAGGDVALLLHRLQHLVAPGQRRPRVEERVVLGRRLRQARDHRRLGQGQIAGRASRSRSRPPPRRRSRWRRRWSRRERC